MATPRRRYLQAQVARDLGRKMVFVSDPRQVGKTTLALNLPDGRAGCLNWDVPVDRERILKRQLPPSSLWVFDEIHKYRSWRNYLKGLFDSPARKRILVTGSARLDYYRYSGDSLQGRYHLLRLHPLSVAELRLRTPRDLIGLLTLGGFPEPYLGGSEVQARRWSRAPAFEAGKPRLLFDSPWVDIPGHELNLSPDGERFLDVHNPQRQPQQTLTVITNFFDELRRRVPAAK